MRNRVTTEIKQVEPDSAEFLELQRQRHAGDQRPVWEQTSIEDALEQVSRFDSGNLRPEDLGDADQPVERIHSGSDVVLPFRPSSEADRGQPTPGELAQGAGRAHEDYEPADSELGTSKESQKVEAEEASFDPGDLADDGDLSPGPGFLEEDDTQRPLGQGGLDDSDELSDSEDADEDEDSEDPEDDDGDPADDDDDDDGDEPRDYSSESKDDLQAEVDKRIEAGRDITVEGTGSNGNVLVEDLIKALEADDAEGPDDVEDDDE